MPKPAPKHPDDAYLHDMLEAARLIRAYMGKVSFDAFWRDNEKRDAVAMRLSVIGEAAVHVSPAGFEIASPTIMVLSTSRLSGKSPRRKSSP
jgi:uncharacterized protein with HEPN domain